MTTDSVRWGILATGGIAAAFTADLIDLPDAEVVAVASRSEASARAFGERFGIPRAYGDWASSPRTRTSMSSTSPPRTPPTGPPRDCAWRPGATCCARSRSR